LKALEAMCSSRNFCQSISFSCAPVLLRGPVHHRHLGLGQRRVLCARDLLKDGIALQLLLDGGGHLLLTELQELDGLLELLGHHELLRLSKLQPDAQIHDFRSLICDADLPASVYGTILA
jgi:hypothetical protein